MMTKTKTRITSLIYAIQISIVIVVLFLIYIAFSMTINNEHRELLQTYAGGFSNIYNHTISKEEIPNREFLAYNYFSVVFTRDNEVMQIDNDLSSGMTDTELVTLCKELLNGKKAFGKVRDYVYLVDKEADYDLVVMLDNTIIAESTKIMYKYIFIFGGITFILLLFVTRKLVKWVMHPAELGYEKQRQFISDAGHELKTPISTIQANAVILNREIGHNRWLENIVFENKRMSDMVIELLDLARIENAALKMEELDMVDLIMSSALPHEAAAFENGKSLIYNLPEAYPFTGDRKQLEKMVSILVDNAISHCKQSGEVVLSLTSVRNKMIFTVSNPGEEIPKDRREHIFERFYRLDESREHKENHYGLGLAIAKSIVLAHKGKISVDCKDGLVIFEVCI